MNFQSLNILPHALCSQPNPRNSSINPHYLKFYKDGSWNNFGSLQMTLSNPFKFIP